MQYSFSCGGSCRGTNTAYTEQSDEAILRTDGNLILNVDNTLVIASQITTLGNIWFKGLRDYRPNYNSTLANSNVAGLQVLSRVNGVIGALRAGAAVTGALAVTVTINGIIDAGSVALSAFNFAIGSLGVTGKDGRPMQHLNMTDALALMAQAGHPLLAIGGSKAHPVINHALPVDLAREVARLPLFHSTEEEMPAVVHHGAGLPVLEALARQFAMGLAHGVMGMRDASLRTLCDNAFRNAELRQKEVQEAQAKTTSGSLVKFGRVQVTEEDLVHATYAMFYTKIKQGISRAQADARAVERLATPVAIDAALTTTPTLEAYLLIPAQAAPKSSVEILARMGNIELTAQRSIDAIRGRKTVYEGDAVKGRVYEQHVDPVLMHAPNGRVILDAPTGVLDHVYPEAAHGVDIAPGITQQDTALAHVSWDHTEEVMRQQREAALRKVGALPGGGMLGMMGLGLMGGRETAAAQFSFGGDGVSVHGFGPGSVAPVVSENPLLDAARARLAPGMARGEAQWAQFEQMAGPVRGPDVRRQLFGGIPVANGIIDRMQQHTFQMQQEHARLEVEEYLETMTLAGYGDEDSSSASSASAATPKHVTKEDKAANKALSTAKTNLERALHQHERQHGDKFTMIEGTWGAELTRLEAETRRIKADPSVSAFVKDYATHCWHGIQAGLREYMKNPGKVAQLGVEVVEIFQPFAQGEKQVGKASLGGDRAANDLVEGSASLALDGMMFAFGPAGYAANVGAKGVAKITKGANKVGKFFMAVHEGAMEKLAARLDAAPYNPRAMEAMLKYRYGADAVASSTLPGLSMPNVKMAGKELIVPGSGARVVFDRRGYPTFDPYSVFETRLTADTMRLSEHVHKSTASRNLMLAIDSGSIPASSFTGVQLEAIRAGKAQIPDLVWHHHQEVGRMQLVPKDLHQFIKHPGGMHNLGGKV